MGQVVDTTVKQMTTQWDLNGIGTVNQFLFTRPLSLQPGLPGIGHLKGQQMANECCENPSFQVDNQLE